MILKWEPVVDSIKKKLIDYNFWDESYIWILLLSDDMASKKYVSLKQKFWKEVWLDVFIYSKDNENIDPYNLDNVLSKIDSLNKDENCLWIVVQLPINETLSWYFSLILSSISPQKDIDWLWWVLFWLNLVWKIKFVPATPKAVLKILEYYKLDDYRWKKISVIWQSNLVWKPLALELMNANAEVFSFNENVNNNDLKNICKISDYIISATWVCSLIDSSYLRSDPSQVIIDVWFWKKWNKVMWDVDYEAVKDYVKAITPVPWWVWPVTVACLFENIIDLDKV